MICPPSCLSENQSVTLSFMPFVSFTLSWTVGSIRLAHFLPLLLSLPLVLYCYVTYFKKWKDDGKLQLMPILQVVYIHYLVSDGSISYALIYLFYSIATSP